MRRLAVAAVVLALFVQPHPARAGRVLRHYDLDSLADQSKAIVRAELGDARPFKTAEGDCVVHTVTVLNAIEGPVAAGTRIRVAGVDAFHQAPGLAGRADSWGPLAKGDVVYLFLVPNDGHEGYGMYTLTNADWTVIESGARLVSGGNVYPFGQLFGGPGTPKALRAAPYGFVAMTAVTFPEVPVETQREFESHLRRSEQEVAQLKPLLAAHPTSASATRMAALLRSRAAMVDKQGAANDELGGKVAAWLDDALTPPELIALRADVGQDVRWELEGGLQQRRDGRSYLLGRIGDVKEGAERRLDFATILEQAGWSYELEVENATADQAASLHVDFATSLARLAVANLGSNVCEPLLAAIKQCDLRPSVPNGALSADLDAAADVLADAFPKAGRLDQVRIADTLMQVRPDRYRRVLPGAGPILPFVQPDRDFDEALRHRHLHLRCRSRARIVLATNLETISKRLFEV